jgi:integrase
LRHSAATLMLLAGVSVHVVAGRLGDDPAVVLRTYSHLIEHRDETAAQKMASALTAGK